LKKFTGDFRSSADGQLAQFSERFLSGERHQMLAHILPRLQCLFGLASRGRHGTRLAAGDSCGIVGCRGRPARTVFDADKENALGPGGHGRMGRSRAGALPQGVAVL
jgi:hypothetical protein